MNYYLYILVFHVMAVMSWMAVMFYLPRLYVYHVENIDKKEFVEIVKIQEYKLYKYIGLPSFWGTVASGALLIFLNPYLFQENWMHLKLFVVILLTFYSFSMEYYRVQLFKNKCKKDGQFFRAYNEIPTLLSTLIVGYVITKETLPVFSLVIIITFSFVIIAILKKKYITIFLENLVITQTTNKIRNGMNSSLGIKSLKKPVELTFDRDRKYFLYMHIPFCNGFCKFCGFHKFMYDSAKCKEYFKFLRKELQIAKDKGFSFDTLYVGGGTPLIDSDELLKTLELTKNLFDIKKISCESSPNNLDPKVIKKFQGIIDRLSIGIQTFDNKILKEINRYDRYGSSDVLQERVSAITGILPNLSLDFIFNMPNQNEEILLNDLKIAKKLQVEQITTYPLMNWKLIGQSLYQSFKTISNSKEYQFYKIIKEEMKGYYSYNAWSFSRIKSTLNDEYVVNRSEYIGVGSGAFSSINNQLFVNSYDLKKYKKLIERGTSSIIAKTEKFTLKQSVEYHFLLNLFGGFIDIENFNKTFQVSLENILKFELLALELSGAIYIKKGKIFSTQFGEFLTVMMMKEFYMGMDNVRAILRNKFLN